jgi:hypothetical protein
MAEHKRGDHGEGGGEVDLNVIITPMLDMAFQLLAFFIMIYQPSSYEVGLDINLLPPEKLAIKGGKPKKSEEPPPPGSDLAPIKDAVLVVVKAYVPEREIGKDATGRKKAGKIIEGMPLEIYIKTPESDLKKIATDSDSEVAGWQILKDSLNEIYKTLPPSSPGDEGTVKTIVKLMPDAALKQRYVLKAWDACRAAKFKVGFVPPPDMPESSTASFKKLADKE